MKSTFYISVLIFFCFGVVYGEQYSVIMDIFPERQIILGTGEKIFSPDASKIRRFTVGEFSFPISKTISLDVETQRFLIEKLEITGDEVLLDKVSHDVQRASAGGVISDKNSKKSYYFLLTKSKILIFDSREKFRVYSGHEVEKWILTSGVDSRR